MDIARNCNIHMEAAMGRVFMNMLNSGSMGGVANMASIVDSMQGGNMVGPVARGRQSAMPGRYAANKTKKFIGNTVTGSIKSFFAVKGWGFVNSDSFDDDCFFNIKLN